MSNEHNFKVGDKVYMAYDPTISAIIENVNDDYKHPYTVRENGAKFTQGCSELDIIDAKTAFLTRLKSLLREFDAEIHDGEMYYISIDVDANSENRQEINYPLYEMDKCWLDADTIMDFDKE